MAEGAFAPIPDRLRAPLDQPNNSQSSLLTDDYLSSDMVAFLRAKASTTAWNL
jgi:hypothetical protein